ncbi:ferritin-like domain-containing protein [Coleofasciculus sp.]|uniref:ferritin-like domain-containing protein n=1 Tax=Coleofasciculus sp. TaxID=3100458 RepID=UPI003A2884DA
MDIHHNQRQHRHRRRRQRTLETDNHRRRRHRDCRFPLLLTGSRQPLSKPLSCSGEGFSQPSNVVNQLNHETQAALVEAIEDEYKARAFYEAVINKFGTVRPFSNIVHAEARHAQRLETLFIKYGVPVPADTFTGTIEAPDSLKTACKISIDGEIENLKMYDRFLSFVQKPDISAAFSQLRDASANRHLPAFERCYRRL